MPPILYIHTGYDTGILQYRTEKFARRGDSKAPSQEYKYCCEVLLLHTSGGTRSHNGTFTP